jgi:predicted DNA-binding protein (MmcQ/YjbR family)
MPVLTNKSPYYNRIRRWCHTQADVTEENPWEAIAFKVKKRVFAICGTEKPLRITLKPKKENLDAYLYHPAIEIASYVGRFGWVTITVKNKDVAALALALVQESYDVVSSRKKDRPFVRKGGVKSIRGGLK